MMKAYKMLFLLLVMLLDSTCVIKANENSTEVNDSNDCGSGFEDGNDSGNSHIYQIQCIRYIINDFVEKNGY